MKEWLGDAILLERRTGADAPAQVFKTLDQKNFDDFETLWRPMLEETRRRVASSDEAAQFDAQDSHWEWVEKAVEAERIMGRDTYAIECAGVTQGLMLVDVGFGRLPGQRGKELVYIELLATAPWNRPKLTPDARYKGVGRVLVGTAVSLSVDLGFGGCIGLHSLAQSEDWYRAVGFTDVEFDNAKDMRYFEMTNVDALAFVSD
ncbi:MAG: GNAT family N-acetyltransferase [Acidiferrobacterales bacterium]